MTETTLEGFEELSRTFDGLAKATARNTAKKALKAGGEPIIDHFRRIAPRSSLSELHMAESGGVGTKLTRAQARQHRKSLDRDFAEVFVGPGNAPAAVQQEFGNVNHPAQPSLTPAWESEKRGSLKIIMRVLWQEIKKSAARQARKQAKLLAKN